MLAVSYSQFGPPDVLSLVEIPEPEPGPGQVRVDLRAASVAPVDCKLRAGQLQHLISIPLPKIPGRDGAGVVSKLGAGVDYVDLGAPVCVVAEHAVPGTYAQCIIADRESLAPLPSSLDFREGAALIHAGVCAWICLVETAALQPGMKVLVQGGAGAVGSLSVQLAHHLGAHVTATCRADNADYVREMGACSVIAYDRDDFTGTAERFDIVVDLIGGDVHRRSYEVLKPGGHMVCLRATPFEDRSAEYGVQVTTPHVHDKRYALDAVTDLVKQGAFRPQISACMDIADAADAHRCMEANAVTRGRIVLDIPPREA
jgi:NADPH:quinone reductase-like Zn-dependent oxidoreductase